ncbi:MAG: HypC/HybG/HupF family hydrogenase formation chaperone [Acidobacteriota bacterium]
MCLAIPGKVVETFDQGGMRMAKVQFGGIIREACLEYVPDTNVGEYVLVHVGFAISKVDEEEAHRTYQILEEMDQLSELTAPVVEEREASVEAAGQPTNSTRQTPAKETSE